MNVSIEQSWRERLAPEFDKPYFASLAAFVREEYKKGPCYPPGPLIFNAFNTTPFDKVKVIILGQDPYHEEGQAMGLCFSVPDGVTPPPSLMNIFREVSADTGADIPGSGDLTRWALQGVLLLNTTLTVRAHSAGSHQRHGWETFTDAVIRALNDYRENMVFMLWGAFARSKAPLIDSRRHLTLTAAHPSPLSAYHGFFGEHHFSLCNSYLTANGKTPIQW